MMKSLVVFYSRTGTTKKMAKIIAEDLNCDLEEVFDQKDRRGFLGWFFGGRDGVLKKFTEIKPAKKDPCKYDLVILGTPIWLGVTPAMRTYIKQNKNRFKKVAFFCTKDTSGAKKTFAEMEKMIGKKPLSVMDFYSFEVNNNVYQNKLNLFTKKLK